MKGMIVDAKAFSEAMNKVSRVLKKSAIPILEEIRVSVKDGVCTLTATDLETWLTARLPVKGDDMSFTFFKTKDVTVQVGDRYVLFTDGEVSLYVHRHGVDTFDVDSAVPKQYQEAVTVRTADFIKELNYLKECASGTNKPYVRFSGESLSMSAPNGKFRTSIPVSGRGDLTLGFDLRYMLDALKQFKDEPEVTVKLSGVFSPIVIEAENRGDFALVLPVRIKEEELAA